MTRKAPFTVNPAVELHQAERSHTGARCLDELVTLRDWLRYAVSRFNAARLVFGHGTDNALDEAVFLLLSALDLPIDQLEPWLDARLLREERERVLALIEARIVTRKPAPYLVGSAWIKGHRFRIDERVIVPRSFIGELLIDTPEAFAAEPADVASVLDLCTGSGCLAILAAMTFENARVDAADISRDALAVASANVVDYGLGARIQVIESDLFAALKGRRYDLIISNPPYVAAAEVAAFPPEYAAEPQLAHLGGDDGLDLVRRLLASVSDHLTEHGSLVVEIGTGREILEAEFPELPLVWLDTEVSEGEVFALAAADLASLSPARGSSGRNGGAKAKGKAGRKVAERR